VLVPAGDLSATALESLLGCPFKWALEHQGLLRSGRGVDIPDGNRLLGDFAHRILQDMVLGAKRIDVERATEDEAKLWAARSFDARVGSEAAPLVRRGREAELTGRALVAARGFVRHLRAGGWKAKAAEHPSPAGSATPSRGTWISFEKPGAEGARPASAPRPREDLEKGRALQLALSARCRGRLYPPAGYLILKTASSRCLGAGHRRAVGGRDAEVPRRASPTGRRCF
jgi:hypothetical protein